MTNRRKSGVRDEHTNPVSGGLNEPTPVAISENYSWLDNQLPSVTREAVEIALEGFPLDLVPGMDIVWLTMAVRRSLASTMVDKGWGPERTSNADMRAELKRVGKLAHSTWQEFYSISDAANSRLWDYSYHGGRNHDLDRMRSAIDELYWLGNFFMAAAKTTASQLGPWRQSESKGLRVERGQYLAPVFEAAFGRPVSANNFPSDARHIAPTPYMDFFERMVRLAFGPQETANLAEVLKAACKKHRKCPVEYPDGVIPGL